MFLSLPTSLLCKRENLINFSRQWVSQYHIPNIVHALVDINMTRGRQRLSTCELRASNIMTRQEDIKIFAELGRTTPARAPSSRTAVMVARRPARLPSKVRAEVLVHLVLPSVEPN